MAEYRYFLPEFVDLATVGGVRKALHALVEDGVEDLVIDCTRTEFMDSAGIAVLLETHRDLAAEGRFLWLTNLNRGPQRVIHVLGLTNLVRPDTPINS